MIASPENTPVTADSNVVGNTMAWNSDVDYNRHGTLAIASLLDGHEEPRSTGANGFINITSSSAVATKVLVPVSATATSSWNTRLAIHTIDGTDLTPNTGVSTGNTIPSSWPVCGNAPDGNMWLTNGVIVGQTIVYDLGSSILTYGFHLWNYNEGSGYNKRSIQTMTVSIGASATGPWTPITLTTTTFTESPGTATYTGETYSYTTPQTAEFIQFSNIVNWENNAAGDPYTGIDEVRFLE